MVSYHTVRLDGITQLKVDGTLDLDASRALLLQVASDVQFRGQGLLIDLRDAEGALSYRDVHEMIGVLIENEASFTHCVALLEDYNERFEKAQFFQAYATERGFAVRAFIKEDAAVAWLEACEH